METGLQKFYKWFTAPNGFYLQSEVDDKMLELIKDETESTPPTPDIADLLHAATKVRNAIIAVGVKDGNREAYELLDNAIKKFNGKPLHEILKEDNKWLKGKRNPPSPDIDNLIEEVMSNKQVSILWGSNEEKYYHEKIVIEIVKEVIQKLK